MDRVGPIIAILYILGGLIQAAAVNAGLADWIGLHWLLAMVLTMPAALVPLLGTILAVGGARVGLHWDWWAVVLLAAPQLVLMPLGLLGQHLDNRDQERRFRNNHPESASS